MPELPEVETVRSGIAEHAGGRAITSVQVRSDRALRQQVGGEAEFTALLLGRTITTARRRGKFLWLHLAGEDGIDEDYALLIHLGMSGQVLIKDGAPAPHPHLRVTLTLGDRSLWFVDQRTFGYMTVVDLTEAGIPASISHIGRDLFDTRMSTGSADYDQVVRRIGSTDRGIKTVLLDQNIVSGIGNIYADEALWRAQLHYATAASTLRGPRIRHLLDATTAVLTDALDAGGTSFDALYVNINGESGYFERSLAVYGRRGQPCNRCGTTILRERFMNRSSYFCPVCQRKPR